MRASLPQLVAVVISFLQDPHQRVRHAALGAIVQLADVFQEDACMMECVPHVAASAAASSGNCPRVRVHAVTALIRLLPSVEEDGAPLVVPHIDTVLRVLAECMGIPMANARMQVLNAVSSVAAAAGPAFAPYYDTFVTGIKGMLASATSAAEASMNVRALRWSRVRRAACVTSRAVAWCVQGTALQCLAFIGQAVGVTRFSADGVMALQAVASVRAQLRCSVGRALQYSTRCGHDSVNCLLSALCRCTRPACCRWTTPSPAKCSRQPRRSARPSASCAPRSCPSSCLACCSPCRARSRC
jgi:hypothetical protein